MLMINCVLDSTHDLACWYERVTSESNLADLPSRLCFDELNELGSELYSSAHPESIHDWKQHCIGRC